jgi:CDP-glucose 4,6-dehydratase
MRIVNSSFWNGKRVFLTGHTGFKGSWISIWLQSMGAKVLGFALEPDTDPALFEIASIAKEMESVIGDIRDIHTLKECMVSFKPEIIIHMAAQPLVRRSYKDPVETYSTNVMGTVHVLEAARECQNVKAIVSVTTDKCYENKEWVWGYRENEPMGGYDPYSSSKACAELVTAAYRRSFFQESEVYVASARAGNVIGGGDWAEDRLIPDALRSFDKEAAVVIRNPKATRPWQHVLEPLSGYLMLAESLFKEGEKFTEGWNFGPNDKDCRPVQDVLEYLIDFWPGKAKWTQDPESHPHEANLLKLDCSKANYILNWQPKWDIETAVKKVVDWHIAWRNQADMRQYIINEIENYNASK